MEKGFGRTSIFFKMVIAFLIVVIPLYALSMLLNRLGETSVEKEWMSTMSSRTLFYMNTLESEKKHIHDLLTEYIYDQDLSHLSILRKIMSYYEWSEAVKRVQDKLRMIKNSSIYVKNASAHLLAAGRTIPYSQSILDTIEEDYDAVKPYAGIDYSKILPWRDRLFIGQSFPDGTTDPVYVISAEIDRTELRNTLQNMTNSGQFGAAFLSLSGEWSLSDELDDSLLPSLQTFVQNKFRANDLEGVSQAMLDGRSFRISYRYSDSYDAYLCMYVPKDAIAGDISFYRKLVWLLSLVSIVIVIAYSYWIYRLIHRPLHKMVRSFRKLEEGRLEPAIVPKGNDEFRYLYLHFNVMVDKLNSLIHDNYEQKLRAKHAQIKQLQSQINPHFLYNTCYILYRLSQFGDLENIGRFSRYLGEYYEFITRHKDDRIPLELELRHAETYIDIQNMRFTNRFEIEVAELPEHDRGLYVPKLILQPIVENAFKYGLEKKKRGGRLRISFEREPGWLRIVVEDNGEQLTDEQIAGLAVQLNNADEDVESTGILNVHRRLQLMCGEGSGIAVSRGELGGMKVTIGIKVERDDADR